MLIEVYSWGDLLCFEDYLFVDEENGIVCCIHQRNILFAKGAATECLEAYEAHLEERGGLRTRVPWEPIKSKIIHDKDKRIRKMLGIKGTES